MDLCIYYDNCPLELLDVGDVEADVIRVVDGGKDKVTNVHLRTLDFEDYVKLIGAVAQSKKDHKGYIKEKLDFTKTGITYAIYADGSLRGMFGVTVVDSSLVVTNYETIDKPPYSNLWSGVMIFLNMLSYTYEGINMLLPVRFDTSMSFSDGDADISDILEDMFSSSPNVVYQKNDDKNYKIKNDDKNYKIVFVPCGKQGSEDAVHLLSTGLDFCLTTHELIVND